MLHLAVFTGDFAQKILKGQKTVDGRFSKVKCAPYGQIQKGDLVLMKKSGGKIVGYFVVEKVKSFEDLSKDKADKLVKKYWKELCMTKDFWKARKDLKYATLIWIKGVHKFDKPVVVRKRDQSGWVVLGKAEMQLELL